MPGLHFTINYYTHPEEKLYLNFTEVNAEGNRITSKYPLSSSDNRQWEVVIVSGRDTVSFEYFYSLDVDGEEARIEWNEDKRTFDCRTWDDKKTVLFRDAWYDLSPYSYLWSSAFTRCWAARPLSEVPLLPFVDVVELRVSVPFVKEGEEVAISGNIPELGQWKPALALPLNEFQRNEWQIRLPLSAVALYKNIEYKLIIRDSRTKDVLQWEEGSNRRLSVPDSACDCLVEDLREPVFSNVDKKKVAGVVIPVFSLRSERSYGVGDFGDLKRLVDWAAVTGMHVIQLLPVNDTTLTHTWMDSYPYNCISIYALHPQYLDISQLSTVRNHRKQKEFEEQRRLLNALPQVDYEAVNRLKSAYMHELYQQEGKSVLKSGAFLQFFEQNKSWLMPYAAFCFLRDTFGTPDFKRWPEYSRYTAADIRRLCTLPPERKESSSIAYYYYVQYYLSSQLSEACDYARRNGVVLKGDIPIGISRESVETWMEPYYFNMDSQAGAPPDPFSEKGQNWGFPTYNWSSMLADKCRWWVNRFRHMSHYFDAYRIDHILGFFRIWDIPLSSVYGLLGQFSPSLPLSVDDIERYGLKFRKEAFTSPYITADILRQLFGERATAVAKTFLSKDDKGVYHFQEAFNTQRKLQAFFQHNAESWFHALLQDEIRDIEEKLYALAGNVLFVEDRHRKGSFHPRIAAQNDLAFNYLLDAGEKAAFNRLYNDYYYHRHNDFWYRSAYKKLPRLVQSTRMLVCGEDLGMIPGCVPGLMHDLRILSLEIESMPKHDGLFADVLKNPYLSVCTIATHDMPTFREWWEEDRGRTQIYYHDILQQGGEAPQVATGAVCEAVIRRHLQSPSMLCLLSWQDWLSMDEALRNPDVHAERINVPAESRHYWRYRMHLTLEQLLDSHSFNARIKGMIEQAGRG